MDRAERFAKRQTVLSGLNGERDCTVRVEWCKRLDSQGGMVKGTVLSGWNGETDCTVRVEW
jgi:ubiquinone biosynthesis protein UbiJ